MRWFKAGFKWMVDYAIEHPVQIAIVIGSGTMTLLAYISSFLNQYGPVAWGAVGILTMLLLAVMAMIVALAMSAFAKAQYLKVITFEPHSTNPLKSQFERERLRIGDFYSPFGILNENKHFNDCEIQGPGSAIFIGNGSVDSCNFMRCDFVVVKKANQ